MKTDTEAAAAVGYIVNLLARGRCLWVDSSCYPIWESLIAVAIQFGNKFPQSTSLAQIKKFVPTPISASTFVLPTVLIHLQSYFFKLSL